jgi:GT2 family glycosyltransferase
MALVEADGETGEASAAGIRPPDRVVRKVSIIILNWNRRDDTLECLRSVQRIDYPDFETIVVDNGSSDGSVAAMRTAFPQVRVLETKENLGYAGGNNVGIRDALERGTDYILLLNNDTIVDPALLRQFVDAAAAFPDGGMFTGKIYFYAEPNRIWFGGSKWYPERSKFLHVGYGEIDDESRHNSICETDYASGCALFVRAEVIHEIGYLDELFFLVYEEVDWCYRAKRAGHRSIFVPRAKIWHKVSASLGKRSPLIFYFYVRNSFLWAERYLTLGERIALFKQVLGEVLPLRSILKQVRSSIDAKNASMAKALYWQLSAHCSKPVVRAKICAVRDYVLRRFGNCPDWIRAL